MTRSLHTDVVEAALRRAVTFRDPATGPTAKVIFHADRGCQYTSSQLAEAAEEVDVRLSVGRTGVCWDNAQIESFWSTLKTEFYDRHTFATHTEATHAVSSWIENVYNRRRRHSALGQITPVASSADSPRWPQKPPNPMSTKRGQPQQFMPFRLRVEHSGWATASGIATHGAAVVVEHEDGWTGRKQSLREYLEHLAVTEASRSA